MTVDEQIRDMLHSYADGYEPAPDSLRSMEDRVERRQAVVRRRAPALLAIAAVIVIVIAFIGRPTAGRHKLDVGGLPSVPARWATIPAAPVPTLDALSFWTGKEMILWGGAPASERGNEGARYDPARRHWQTMAKSPLPVCHCSRNLVQSGVWTGTKMIIWGGDGHGGLGAAYDPRRDRWQMISPAPLRARAGNAAVWTGREMIVWGGSTANEIDRPAPQIGPLFNDGAAYEPGTDTWRLLPPAPATGAGAFNPLALWTGTDFIVLAGKSTASYNPFTNTWHLRTPSPGVGNSYDARAVWTGAEAVVVGADFEGHDFAYNPASDSWRTLPSAPLSFRRIQAVAWTGRALIEWGGVLSGFDYDGDGAMYDPMADAWTKLPRSPLRARAHASSVWTGTQMLIVGGAGATPRHEGIAEGIELRDGAALILPTAR